MSGFTSVVESTFCSLSPQTALVLPFSLPPSPRPPRALPFFFYSFRYRSQPRVLLRWRHPLRGRLPAIALKCHVAEVRRERVLTYDGRRDSSKSVRWNLSRRDVRWKFKKDRNWCNASVYIYMCIHMCACVRARGTLQRCSTLFIRSIHMLTSWYDSKIYRDGCRGAEL